VVKKVVKKVKRSDIETKIYRIRTNAANSVINFANGLRNVKQEEGSEKKVWKF